MLLWDLMVDSPRCFITAILDVQLESFISASLRRQGFIVDYRGISAELLSQYLLIEKESRQTLLIADDFHKELKKLLPRIPDNIEVIQIQVIPQSDFDVAELIRPLTTEVRAVTSPLMSSTQLLGIASIGSRVGTSTIALNIAKESALQGIKTLIVDANHRSPFLVEHFNIFGLNRGAHQLGDCITLLELQEGIEIENWIEEFNRYEFVILDVGEIIDVSDLLSGRRKGDLALRWLAQQASELIIVSEEEVIKKSYALQRWKLLCATAMRPSLTFILNTVIASGRGERERKIRFFQEALNTAITLVSRDERSLATMRSQRSTLADSSPKSRTRNEIADFCRSRHWWSR